MSAFHRSEFENKCALAPPQSLPALTLLRGFSLDLGSAVFKTKEAM